MKKQSTFLGMPYNWRWPTWKTIFKRMWNKSDHRLFPPKAFGWGYTINFYELLYRRPVLVVVILISCIILLGFGIERIQVVRQAHSTFENYYAFRGCTQLEKKTADYAICETNQGDMIKMVKFQNKWYLDGDLPTCVLHVCF